jgi:membrane-associated protease RseP (regulator of RpoE activity)
MKSTVTLLVVCWMCALAMHESRVIAQPLPGPADDDATAGPELASPAELAPEEMPGGAAYRARLGITLDPRYRAAVVRSVAPGSPAEHAGLQPGDTIEALNARRVDSYQDVQQFIDGMRPGDIVDIDFSRRITGRTQAVLEGAAPAGPAGRDANGGRFRRDAVDQAVYDELPPPSSRSGSPPNPGAGPSSQSPDGGDERASGADQRGQRASEPDQEQDNRRRPFRRWRRN